MSSVSTHAKSDRGAMETDGCGGDAFSRNSVGAGDGMGDYRLSRFLEWLHVNGIRFQGCALRPSSGDRQAGLGVFATHDNTQGVMMITPLIMAITPMTVLQDPLLGPRYCQLFEEGDVDDRLLIMIFLVVERARGPSSFWAPVVDFEDFLWANCIFWTRALNIPCPHSFVFPSQLSVPPALQALQESNLQGRDSQDSAGRDNETLGCVDSAKATHPSKEVGGTTESEENHIDIVMLEEHNGTSATKDQVLVSNCESLGPLEDGFDRVCVVSPHNCSSSEVQEGDETTNVSNEQEESVWVEGLVPGIDFCNHDHKAVASWEVDGSQGSLTGVPCSMYLVTVPGVSVPVDSEIRINYGNKGNEELLYLYGFVMDSNPDDYLMVYFPKEALERSACFEEKSQLLAQLKLPLRWLLPSSELSRGFLCHEASPASGESQTEMQTATVAGHSWSGHRKPPANLEHLVFPEDLLAALRVVAMEDDEVYRVISMLEDISNPDLERIPSYIDIRAAVWEVCGNTGALQLLIDLLTSKVMEIEEGTGLEDVDVELLAKDLKARSDARLQQHPERAHMGNAAVRKTPLLSENKRACVIYRKGQKRLARLFLQEAEQALDKCV